MIKPNQQRLYEYDFGVNNKNKSIILKMREASQSLDCCFQPVAKVCPSFGIRPDFFNWTREHILRNVKVDKFHGNMSKPIETPLDQEVEQVDQKQTKSPWDAGDQKTLSFQLLLCSKPGNTLWTHISKHYKIVLSCYKNIKNTLGR